MTAPKYGIGGWPDQRKGRGKVQLSKVGPFGQGWDYPSPPAGWMKNSDGTQYVGLPGVIFSDFNTQALSADTDYYAPFYVRTPVYVDQLLFEVTTLGAASNGAAAIYPADADWQPDPKSPPLADSGDIATSTTGTKTFTLGSPLLLLPGRYLSAINVSATAPALRQYIGSIDGATMVAGLGTNPYLARLKATRTHAAFPTPGAKWTAIDQSGTGISYFVMVRVSDPYPNPR